jgi:hypothetical protein
MKVAIMTRLDTVEDCKIELYLKNFSQVLEGLGYVMLEATYGKHRVSARPHTHLHYVCDVSGGKYYKELSQKINNTIPMKQYRLETKVKKAISYNYDDGKKDKNGHDFDEKKILQYPLKEYPSKQNMVQDLGQIIDEENISKQKWEEYRVEAYKMFCRTRKKKEKDSVKKRQKQYEFLDSYVKTQKIFEEKNGEEIDTIKDYMKVTIAGILKWHKQEDLNFNPSALKGQALNYLYKSEIITHRGVLSYINI